MGKQNIDSIYRLSPMQEGILFHTLESARPGVYFEQYSCTLAEQVDTRHLEQAWEVVAERHPVMRTLFTWEGREKPLQIVRERVSLPWVHQDWREVPASEQARRWNSFVQRDRDRGFDLARAPLSRFALIRLAQDRFRFLWSFHHLLIDGWSMQLILDEVFQLYQAFGGNSASRLEPARPYGDFIAWLERRDSSRDEAFWSEKLRGFSAPTSPLFSRAAQAAPGPNVGAGTRTVQLSPETVERLESLARRERLTVNTLVLGAWALVLGRASGCDDLVFGTTVSGRSVDLPGVERTAGLFINTLPLRVRVPGEIPILSWLHDIQAQQIRLREFEQTPLVAIQHWTDLPAGTPLFETIVVFQNLPPTDAGARARSALKVGNESYVEYSNYPVAILAFPGRQLTLTAVHDTRRFDASSAERMLTHLQTALEELAMNPTRTLSALPMSSRAERALVVEQWNATQADFPRDCCIHQLIEAQVAATPNAVAVAFEDECLTYSELNRRANQLAHYLQSNGVARGGGVPIFLERSPEAMIAILAVLKAGAAYVPLDPLYPKERVRHVLEDLFAGQNGSRSLILTRAHLLERLPGGSQPVFCMDRNWREADRLDDRNLQGAADPAELAYVIYTSGSTGRPKGVMVSHRNLVNSTCARTTYYPEAFSSYLLLSSLATDSSVAGIFWSLCRGATLVLPRGRLELDVLRLAQLAADGQISHLLCLPSLYALVLEHSDPEQLASLQAVILAGEACPRGLVEHHHEVLPGVSLYNEYGPTETTVWATVANLPPGSKAQVVSIGRPIANLTVYILDDQLRPLPPGFPGEIYIGGAGVARGYWNQPARTAERFIHDPFCSEPDARLYRTGDLGRHLPDGNIEFLGRVDNQVKIRGYRVELEEIEHVLARHPGVSEAVVVVEGDGEKAPRRGRDAMQDPQALTGELLSLGVDGAERLLSEIEQLSTSEVKHGLGEFDTGDGTLAAKGVHP